MKNIIGLSLMLLSMGGSAFAGVVTAPEIDAATGAAALALLSGGLMVLRSRRKKQ